MFTVEEHITYDKTRTYFKYYLIKEAWDKLVEQGLPETQKGYANYKLVSRGVLEEAENDLIKQQQNISTRLANIDVLLNEDT